MRRSTLTLPVKSLWALCLLKCVFIYLSVIACVTLEGKMASVA